jgi:uncharacterized repeat protein (TIGR01451 family)
MKVKVTAPGYKLQKTVRANGTTTYSEEASVKAGDKVDFSLGFQNSGTTTLNNVVIGDRLPVGLTYVPGTTEWNSTYTNKTWTKVTNDDWLKGGLNVGAYAPNGTVFVRFTAQVDDASKLQCGLNQFVNHAFAQPEGQGTIQDSANVKVTKECATPTPVYSCDLLEMTKDDAARTVTVKDFKQTATNGATFKNVVINWGDGTEIMTDAAVGKTHQYAKDGTYTIKAVPHFTVNGADFTAEGVKCVNTVSFTAPATPVAPAAPAAPTELINVGAGNIFSLFAAAVLVGAIFHRLFLSRRTA